MSITHDGKTIAGTHGLVEEHPIDVQRHEFFYWGLGGVSEIYGGRGGQNVSLELWLHDQYTTMAKLATALKELDARIGDHGTLVVQAGTRRQTFDYLTFLGFERQPLGGRSDVAPVYDWAGTVDGGWVQAGVLQFRRLRPSS